MSPAVLRLPGGTMVDVIFRIIFGGIVTAMIFAMTWMEYQTWGDGYWCSMGWWKRTKMTGVMVMLYLFCAMMLYALATMPITFP